MLKNKKSLAVILSLVMLLAMACGAWAALTPVNGVYEIGTEADLIEFRDLVNGGTFDANAKLMADIDLQADWIPIGLPVDSTPADEYSAAQGYIGTFDGGGFKISGLTFSGETEMIKASIEAHNNAANFEQAALWGLFSQIGDAGVVKNLAIAGDVTLTQGAFTDLPGDYYFRVGMLAAHNWGTVQNCRIYDNEVTINIALSSAFTPGVGAMLAENQGEVVYSHADGVYVKLTHAGSASASTRAGGMIGGSNVGSVYDSSISNSTVILEFLTGSSVANGIYCGGLTGSFNGATDKLENCTATNVTVEATGPKDTSYLYTLAVGGLSGQSSNSGNVIGCNVYNTSLEALSSVYAYAGGLLGAAGRTAIIENNHVENIVMTVDLEANSDIRYIIAGGLVGLSYAPTFTTSSVFNVSADLSISGSNSGTIRDCGINAGMLVGQLGAASDTPASVAPQLNNCIAFGELKMHANASATNLRQVLNLGGLVGAQYWNTVVSNSVLDGNTNITYSGNADTTGTRGIRMASLIGRIAPDGAGTYPTSKLENCTITGTVSLQGKGVLEYWGALFNRESNMLAQISNISYPVGTGAFDAADVICGGSVDDHTTNISGIVAYNVASDDADLPAQVLMLSKSSMSLATGASDTVEVSSYPGSKGFPGEFTFHWGTADSGVVTVTGDAGGTSAVVAATSPESANTRAILAAQRNTAVTTLLLPVFVVKHLNPDGSDAGDYIDPVITGTPEGGFIYEGEAVRLTYDFDPYVAIPEIDNTGMDGSGLLAAILNGKVVLIGVEAGPAGTYSYIVKLQAPDGSVITQTVYVTIQGGSRPTGNGTGGGGSSNCNAGMGVGALVSLLGLALVMKRK